MILDKNNRGKALKKLVIIILILITGVVVLENQIRNKSTDKNLAYTFVITDTPMYRSLDPLDADQTVNLLVARMLYATPMEININGELQSSILDSYDYDDEIQTMVWKLKSGLKYSDGSIISSEDVAFSVVRMIYTRPKFPVIEDIAGVQDWLKSKMALTTLPSGIKIDGQSIKIRFSKKQKHPQFRFCLEIFSIIPKNCIDVRTNKLNCAEIPYSGHYKLTEQNKNEVHFEKRSLTVEQLAKAPDKITFKYMLPTEALESFKNFDDHTILAGNEIRYKVNEMKLISDVLVIKYMPTSRMAAVVLNSEAGAFKDQHCRHYFAQSFRRTYEKIAQGKRKIEYSFVTDLLPGFLNKQNLESSFTIAEFSPEIVTACKEKFSQEPIYWSKPPTGQRTLFVEIMDSVFDEMGIKKTEPIITETQSIEDDLFMQGKVSVINFQTGFWPLDPAGDIQMLMTPNMHEVLNFATRDEKLQTLIRNLKSNLQLNSHSEAFENINRYIYKQSIFNVFTHVRRFYASKNKSLLAEAPTSITSPAPWQVFKLD